MLLVWLHGAELAGTNPAKELYQALMSTGNRRAAGTQKESSLHKQDKQRVVCNSVTNTPAGAKQLNLLYNS